MNDNDVLRQIRYIFNYSDSQMTEIFTLSEAQVSKEQVCAWLKPEEDPALQECQEDVLANFLNGLIVKHRGKKKEEQPRQEKKLTNNSIFMKLKIALDLKADDILQILELAEFKVSKHDLSALFRKSNNKHYRECKDQLLCNFLKGLQLKYRDQN